MKYNNDCCDIEWQQYMNKKLQKIRELDTKMRELMQLRKKAEAEILLYGRILRMQIRQEERDEFTLNKRLKAMEPFIAIPPCPLKLAEKPKHNQRKKWGKKINTVQMSD